MRLYEGDCEGESAEYCLIDWNQLKNWTQLIISIFFLLGHLESIDGIGVSCVKILLVSHSRGSILGLNTNQPDLTLSTTTTNVGREEWYANQWIHSQMFWIILSHTGSLSRKRGILIASHLGYMESR